MKISDQIAALLKQRGVIIERMEALHAKVVGEDNVIRAFTEEEQKTFNTDKDAVAGIDAQLVNLRATEAAMAAQAVAIPRTPLTPTPGVEVKTFKPFKGQSFVRYCCALARSKGNLMQAELFAKGWEHQTPEVLSVIKAAVAAGTTTDPTWAAPLVQYNDMVSEFIELLRPETILGRIQGMRQVPFMTRMPRQTAGSTANWVGEGLSKPVSKLAFDTVLFPFAKIATIIVITQELARLSTPSAEVLVRDDMIKAIAEFMDTQFTDPAVAPLANVHPGSITNGVTAIPSTGSTVATVTKDLSDAMLAMVNGLIPMKKPYWIMSPTAFMFLSLLRTAQDIFAFRAEMLTGTLFGVPIVQSTQMPLTGARSSIILFDAAEIMYADDGQTVIDSSGEASLQMDSAPATPPTPLVSLWQQNMLGIKAERFCYWERRRLAAVQVITGFPL
jgi:HK97 family phage major capsid protein